MISIHDKYKEAKEEYERAKKVHGKIQGALYNFSKERDNMNAQIPQLLHRYYIEADESAKAELWSLYLDRQMLDDSKQYLPSLLRRAADEMERTLHDMNELQKQVDFVKRQASNWKSEYKSACGRMANATFANIDVIERRLMECARHEHVNKEEEALALVELRRRELKEIEPGWSA